MVKNFLRGGKALLYSKQANILSAAAVIMVMVAASRVLGLIRNRTFAHFFEPEQLDVFFAAFQLPDLLFEILVLGAISSAFIPVFASYLTRGQEKEGWETARIVLNIILLFFLASSVLIFIFAGPIYSFVARGFSPEQVLQTVAFTRMLLVVQFIFAASYLLTAVLESNQRFFAPAVAPLFYNLGIIVVTALFASQLGLLAPVLGAVLGSVLHLLVQLPLAFNLGFRPALVLDFKNPGVRKVARLATPRVVELSFFQIKRLTDLFLASFVAGGLTYFKFADQLAALPVGLFGLSIAKASLPSLSRQAAKKSMEEFKKTFAASFKEILFLVIPVSFFLAVLRIPAVRLVFGAQKFDWPATVQTGYTVSAFAVGIFAWALALLVSRAFYALHDTATPVKVSILTIFVNVALALFLILGLKFDIWALALSYAIAGVIQIVILLVLLGKKVGGFAGFGLATSFVKILFASAVSGGTMFILLKILDRSAWDKKLSFLGELGLGLPTTFDRFVLDTRYTVNLILLTALVAAVGLAVYLALVYLLKVEELSSVLRALARVTPARARGLFQRKPSPEEVEPIAPTHTNGT